VWWWWGGWQLWSGGKGRKMWPWTTEKSCKGTHCLQNC
jgi:hypothetical protein